jgi:ribonuclease BN (tRNA processing enzyme)
MIIRFLGTGSGMAVPHRSMSSILVRTNNRQLLLDAGEGTLFSMLRWKVDPNAIDDIFITHTHPDHATGIISLLHRMFLTGRKNL